MKARIKKQDIPLMTRIEFNEKFGRGYQARMNLGSLETIIDCHPLGLGEICAAIQDAIEEINRMGSHHYDFQKVTAIDGEAIKKNKTFDFQSALLAKDIKEGKGRLCVPAGTDYGYEEINGKREQVFTARGTLLVVYFSWIDDRNPKAKRGLERYCQYLAMHGYGGGATAILEELDSMDKARGASWIKATYGKYVKDDAEIIQLVLS